MKRIIATVMGFVLAMMVLGSAMMLLRSNRFLSFGVLGVFVPSEEKKIWREEGKGWNEEQAKSTAKSYLEEKYGGEFIYVSNSVPPRSYPDDLIIVCDFKRKDNEEAKAHGRYAVDVVYKSGEYTVVGDEYMFVHIRKVAEDFLRPYVENRFSDMEFVFFVKRTGKECGALHFEYFADAEIPQSFDEIHDVTSKIEFKIIVPKSEDQNKVSEACSLLKSDLEELDMNIKVGGYIDVYGDDHFAEIRQYSDPRGHDNGFYSREKIM